MSLKALLNYVLEEVAIDGEEGTTVEELFRHVNNFYVANLQRHHNVSELLGKNQPDVEVQVGGGIQDGANASCEHTEPESGGSGKASDFWGIPNVKEEFQEYIWDLLRQEKDFIVGQQNEAGNMSLKGIVEMMKAKGGAPASLRVCATEERRWKTLTGHGPDPKKVPNAVFRCLEVIGKHREKGLIQPDLTKVTGQDKKSVAGRTTLLKDLGYIEKINVLAKSMNTSKLTLTKFAVQRDQKRIQASKKEEQKGEAIAGGAEQWTGDTIHLESLVRAIISELKSAKNNVLQRSDLKKKLGMDKSKFHWRSLSRILRKVESFGVWRRIRVPLPASRSHDRKSGQNVTARAHARCIKFLREVTEDDLRRLVSSSKASLEVDDEGDEGSDAEDDDKGGKENDDMDVDAINEQLAHVDVDLIEEIPREVPQWSVDIPMPNLIYNLVAAAGKGGISSMEVVQRAIGPFYYRPMDQILHRMTDLPSKSQPPQYIHLAVIRERSITHRQTHYHYFSYEWHQELVKAGLATEPWAAKGKKKSTKAGPVEDSDDQLPETRKLDEFGFPAVNSARLLKKDGSASLADSQLVAKMKENFAPLSNQPGWKRAPCTGRPRKYEKGKEPYLAGKRRRAAKLAAKEALAKEAQKKRTLEDAQDEPAKAEEPIQTKEPVQTEEPTQKRRPRGRPPKKQKTSRTSVASTPRTRGTTRGKNAKAATAEVVDVPEMSVAPPSPLATDIENPPDPPASSALARASRPITESFTPTMPTTPQAAPQTPPVAVQDSITRLRPARRGRRAAPEGTIQTTSTRKRKRASPAPVPPRPVRRGKHNTLTDTDVEMFLAPPENAQQADAPENEDIRHDAGAHDGQAESPTPLSPQKEPEESSNPAERVEGPPTEAPVEAPTEPTEPALADVPEPPALFEVDGLSIQAEKYDADNDSYGSVGGMLALGRQQVVLDLVAEHQGVFPGGNELRHAFNKRYKKNHPTAGSADRRLIRGVVQSLQNKGKINQFSFSLQTIRGVITKKLLVDSKIPVDSPLVTETIQQIKAAEGNLWFPPGTELPADVQDRVLNPNNTWVQAPSCMVEETEFDRIYPTSIDNAKERRQERAAAREAKNWQKAEDKRMRAELRLMRGLGEPSTWTGKFTDEQREEARRRKAELKSKIDRLRFKFQAVPDGAQELPPGTRTIWWGDFVRRSNGNSLLKDIKDVSQYELNQGKELFEPSNQDGLVMINHFGPEVAVSEEFRQARELLQKRARSPVVRAPRREAAGSQKSTEKGWQNVETSQTDQPLNLEANAAPTGPAKKRVRRRVLKNAPTESRRQKAMAALHTTTTLDKVEEEQEDMLSKKASTHRNQYAIPKEDEDTLLIAVIIVRTIFGNIDRKINWNLVQKAMPQHQPVVFQRRWPRVRDVHKTHLKRLQSEFEEMYLEAYAQGKLPPINIQDPMSFDLAYHIKWFRDNLELPEAYAAPELCSTREEFDNLYRLSPEKPSTWRVDYHNPSLTMGNRANHFVCYAYELPMGTDKEAGEGTGIVDYVKSIIKANIMTDSASYNPMEAFSLIRAQPEDAVDEAFFELTNSKVIAHRKEHTRVAPGRNYELTDKFHLSLRTPMDEKMFAQALKFEKTLQKMFEQKESLELSPFLNDGSVACIFDLVAHRRVRLEKREYCADVWGLVEGYETRSMPKSLVDFKIDVRAQPGYFLRPEVAPLPPTPDGKTGNPIEPVRLWIDMNGSIIKGAWLRVVVSVLSLITGRPGIRTGEIARMLHPGMTQTEVTDVVGWLDERGTVEFKRDSRNGVGCWAKEGFYRALAGL